VTHALFRVPAGTVEDGGDTSGDGAFYIRHRIADPASNHMNAWSLWRLGAADNAQQAAKKKPRNLRGSDC
ncbi:MAG: hypothetical protein VXW49_04125, partial [Pseudomonadota bacterium]|nr:hypothetical protein [Pseudomonadota bacterium]